MLQNRDGDPVYPETVYEYEYTNTAWQDQLTAIKTYTVDASGVQTLSDTQSFAYDAMGNPTSYLGKTLAWEGKQLTGITATGQSISYAYDENGLRTQKTVDGTTTNYYYNGSLLIGITVGYRVMRFSYDINGNVVAMDYSTDYGANFTTYYYFRNGQGDIIKLINDNGTVAATYEYDSWGNITAIGGTLPQTLAIYQPFRYRGYVYDNETGWYYLQSRYYNPETCRFISADTVFDNNAGICGYNLYAYCANNPIIYFDSTGESITLICILIGAGVGLIVGAIGGSHVAKSQGYTIDDGWLYLRYVIGFGIGGAAVGALMGWGVGAAIEAIGAVATAGSGGTLGKVLYDNWQAAEQSVRDMYGGVKQCFSTPYGQRIVDSYSNGVASEVKYGYQGLSQAIQQQIAKDAWLLGNGYVDSVEWHFYWSTVSNSGGPSDNLLRALLDAGFRVIFH